MFIFHFTSVIKPLPHKYSIGVFAYDAFTSFSGHESCPSVCRVGFSRNVPLLVIRQLQNTLQESDVTEPFFEEVSGDDPMVRDHKVVLQSSPFWLPGVRSDACEEGNLEVR